MGYQCFFPPFLIPESVCLIYPGLCFRCDFGQKLLLSSSILFFAAGLLFYFPQLIYFMESKMRNVKIDGIPVVKVGANGKYFKRDLSSPAEML